MATRSTITYVTPDNHVYSIYCHYDGYLQNGVGETLLRDYTDPDKAKALCSSPHDIRSLYETVETTDFFDEEILSDQPFIANNNLYMLEYEEYNYIYLFNSGWNLISTNRGKYTSLEDDLTPLNKLITIEE